MWKIVERSTKNQRLQFYIYVCVRVCGGQNVVKVYVRYKLTISAHTIFKRWDAQSTLNALNKTKRLKWVFLD